MWYVKLLTIILLSIAFASCSKEGGYAPTLLADLTSVPAAPTNLTASAGNSTVTLNWQASPASSLAVTYTVYRSQASGSAYAALAGCADLTVLTCIDVSALNGITYYYIVRANNIVGASSDSNEVSATPTNATSPPGSLSYSNSSPTYTVNVAITNNTPSAAGGGPITSWSISPNLNTNTGLSFNTSTGVISGTPTIVSNPGVTYTITATNAYGSSTVNLLVVVGTGVAAPTISYTGTYTYTAGQTLGSPITPTLGGGAPTSCTSSPALPSGFVLNSTTCAISGTPTATAAQQLYTITATNSGGSGTGTVNIGVIAGGPNNIAITGVANFTTAACALFTLTSRDSFGNASNVAANTSFNLSGAGAAGAFYSDSLCSTPATSVSIANGSSSVVFYYRKTTSGSASLTATLSSPTNPALGSASRNVNVAISTPAKYGLVVPSTGTSVSCNPVTVNVLDSSDNAVNATSNLTVNLSGTASAAFFSNSTCSTSASSVAIATGANTATVYMRKTSVGASTLTASSTGMASGTGSITISVGPAARVIFSSPPASPFGATSCQTYTLQTRDALNNNVSAVSADTTVTLSGVSDGSFYSNSTCSAGNEITTTTITSGTSSRVIYYRKPTSTAVVPGSNITLTAAVSGWSPDATATISVSSGSPTNIASANGSVGIAVSTSTQVTLGNRCLATALRVQDELNALVPTSSVTSPIVVNLSGGVGGSQFFSNNSCTTSISSITIPTNTNTVNFYYSSPATSAGAVPIVWSNGGLSGVGGQRNVTVTSGVPSRLTWTTNPSSFNTNTCQTYTFNVRDPNTVTAIGTNVSSATDFALSDGSDGIFYSTSGCSNPTTTVQVANGAQTATFYYRKTTASAATISVALQSPTNPAITTLNQAITVNAPPVLPNNILISASPATSLVATQSCSLITLQSRNGSTPTNVNSNTTVTLAASNGGQFYYDSGCTAVASPLTMTIANGTNSISGLYVRTANTGNVVISGSASITVNSLTLSYAAPPPTMLALTGPILLNAGATCGSYTVTTQDSAGINRNVSSNTAVTFASTGSVAVQFYSDSSCTVALPSNQATVTTGTNSANVFVRGNTAGSAQIQVTAPGLTSASQSVNIQ